nr:sensor histidine kinase [Brevibacillus dissolubilis]
MLIGGIIIIGGFIKITEDELSQRLLITARTVAEIPLIRDNVQAPGSSQTIEPITRRIRIINDVTYIIVMDMNRTRLSDPLPGRIGQSFLGRDAEPAFAEHSYVTKVKGEMGTALRAYVPIMSAEHQQVGVVLVGHILPGIDEIVFAQREKIFITLFLSLLFGILGSGMLAAHMKKQMFDLEPHEIARILQERTAAFHAMHEGVIAVDNLERITIFNDTAKRIFGIQDEVLGKPIREVLPDTRLPEILYSKQPIYNRELHVGRALIWSNRIPIKVGEKIVGAVAIFQDRTEVARMAEELTGVKAFVEALRVQNHEHLNKLHTIAGLLQLDHKEQALDYLFQITEQQEELTSFLKSRIQHESIAGLLLSKVTRGKELGIEVHIDRRSRWKQFPRLLDQHDFVLILGNLFENAFDSFTDPKQENKQVYVSIEQDETTLSIMVEDNGSGMTEEVQTRILQKGFSTKGSANRGFGLHLVHQIVEKGHGDLHWESEPGIGTSFIVTFPMERR